MIDQEFQFIELEEAATKLDLNVATLRKAIDNGELAAIKDVWRGYRTTKLWISRWLQSKTINPEAAGPEIPVF